MLNVFLQNKSLKFQWLHRLLNGETGHFWQIQLHNTFKVPIVEALQFNLCPSGWHKMIKNIKSTPPLLEGHTQTMVLNELRLGSQENTRSQSYIANAIMFQ